MGIIKAKDGAPVTIGDFSLAGYPQVLTNGQRIPSPDPGIPLRNYHGKPTNPGKLWKTQPALRKVVSFAAREIGQIPWHAYQRISDGDRKRLKDSPVERLLGKPAKLQHGYQLIRDLVVDGMLYDMFCAVLIDDELVRIPAGLISITSDWLGRPTEIWIRGPRRQDDIEITDFPKAMSWGWNPDKAGGVSPMHTLASLLNENLRAVEWRSQKWEQAPKISGVLTMPKDVKWKDEQRERFKESWAQWREAPNAGGTPILENGMEYKELNTITPLDAQDVEGRQLTDAEVASAFHIPPELVGARPGNFSNIDAFRQMLFGPTLGPLIQEMQQAFNNGGIIESLDLTPGLYLEVNREAMMQGSFLEQARVMQATVGGPWMTRAEARAMRNMPFLEGTDELIVPLNVTEGGQASPTDTGDQNLGGENAAPENRFP